MMAAGGELESAASFGQRSELLLVTAVTQHCDADACDRLTPGGALPPVSRTAPSLPLAAQPAGLLRCVFNHSADWISPLLR